MSRVYQTSAPFYILAADGLFTGEQLFERQGPPFFEIMEIGDDGGLVTEWPTGKDDDLNFDNGQYARDAALELFGEGLKKLKPGWDYELAEADTKTPMVYCELAGVAIRFNMDDNLWECDEDEWVAEYMNDLEAEGEWEDSGADPQPPVDRIRRMMGDLGGKLLAVMNYPEGTYDPNVVY